MDKNYRKGKYTEGPNEDGYYTAGIDASFRDWRDQLDWHLHAIEFHSKEKVVAESRRDLVFMMLEKPSVYLQQIGRIKRIKND